MIFRFVKSSDRTIILRWPITATAITKRNTVNKEILINKKIFLLTFKKGLLFHLKKICLQRKRIYSHIKKVCLHTENKPAVNSHRKFSRQTATANSCGKFPLQILSANSYSKQPLQIYGKECQQCCF